MLILVKIEFKSLTSSKTSTSSAISGNTSTFSGALSSIKGVTDMLPLDNSLPIDLGLAVVKSLNPFLNWLGSIAVSKSTKKSVMLASSAIDVVKFLKDIVPSPKFSSPLILSNKGCIKSCGDFLVSSATPRLRSAGYKYCVFPVCLYNAPPNVLFSLAIASLTFILILPYWSTSKNTFLLDPGLLVMNILLKVSLLNSSLKFMSFGFLSLSRLLSTVVWALLISLKSSISKSTFCCNFGFEVTTE